MNTQPLTTEEQERAAYLAGDTRTAELLAQIAELEAERDTLAEELENLKDTAADDSLEHWENENGPPKNTKNFSSIVSPVLRATTLPPTFQATTTSR
jgi:hypothetical protein